VSLQVYKFNAKVMKIDFAKSWRIGCFFLLLVLSDGMPVIAQAADTLKIGISDGISGAFEATGRAYVAGVQFVVDEQNAKGGLLGKKIELFVEDNELKPDVAVRKSKKHILENRVDILGAGLGSHNVLAATKVAEEYKKVFINYGGLADSLTGKDFSRYSFRVTCNTYDYAVALAKFMAKKPYRRFYVLCQDYAYGHDAGKAFKDQLKIHFPAAQIVGEDYHPLATKDFAPYISKIIAAKADAVFTPNWGPDGVNLIKQARSLGLKSPFSFVCTTTGNDPYIQNELKDDAIGIHVAFPHDLAIKIPENGAMLARFHAKHKNDKDFMY
jgi:branched-chain amino acid transport system substrate-binding protein